MKYFLYGHNGSGNHGCEAIVRSTYKLLNSDENSFVLATGNKDEDKHYGLNSIVQLLDEKNYFPKYNPLYIRAYLSLKVLKNELPSEELAYLKTFNSVEKDSIALSIGGDNYCYPGYERFIMLHNMLAKRGIKTVLWGCSVEPASVETLKNDLCNYNLIVARESLSYNALKSIGANVGLNPDPAFWLDLKEPDLSENFINNSVGINLSPMVIGKEKKPGIILNNYIKLVNYILNNTKMNVILIPHVIWAENNDDRIPLKQIYDVFKDTNRVLLIDDQSCENLKGIISKCRFFIGARTHSTIAAYSQCIPTLVVGYSIKAKGIAKDLFGTFDNYVIPAQNMADELDLTNAFKWLVSNETKIQQLYSMKMPEYLDEGIRNIEKIKKKIEEL